MTAETNQALVKVLLEFKAAPGRFALNLGQPVLIFQYLDTVINWAQGKIEEELIPQKDALQSAAIFFIQRACFKQENNLYEVLGLGRDFNPDTVRPRYRALISLTHPDKGIQGLATDAAVRINKAYKILQDSVSRADYDESLRTLEKPALSSSEVLVGSFTQSREYIPPTTKNIQTKRILKIVAYSIPLLFGATVVALIFSSGSSDLHLVEKRISTSKSVTSDSANLQKSELSQPSDLATVSGGNISSRSLSQDKETNFKIELNHSSLNNIAQKPQQTSVKIDSLSVSKGAVASNEIQQKETRKISESTSEYTSIVAVAPLVNTAQNVNAISSEVKRPNLQSTEAKLIVGQLIAALERTKETEVLQSRLIAQGVSGNLFGLALPHLRQSASVRVDQLILKEKFDNNNLILNGSVALLLGSTANQMVPFRYAVHAEFKDFERGLVLSNFDLKESK